ncbi:MAG: CIA30 family protein [Chloroflexota bacterium]
MRENRIFSFGDRRSASAWVPISDVVMGGVSVGHMESAAGGYAAFTGRVSFENDGGFASVRSEIGLYDLGTYEGLMLRVRGDGKRYKLNLRTDERFDGIVYQTRFGTVPSEWIEVRIPFGDFFPAFRGIRVNDAPPLDTRRIRSFGLLISDRQEGPFRLEIAWLSAYTA